MFLLVLTLPVITSGVILLGWWPYVIALLSVVLVIGLALLESRELRWYLSQLGIPLSHLAQAWPAPLAIHPFHGLETGPAYQFTLLETFIVLQFTVALLSTTLASRLLHLHSRLQVSMKSFKELQSFFQSVLSASTEPGLIMYTDSRQVMHASATFFKRMLLAPEEIIGKGLFELIAFAQPERLQRALEAERGEVPFCICRVGAETRVSNVHFHRAEYEGTLYTYVGLRELTEVYYLHAAFNAVGDPLLAIGSDKCVLYFNLAAQELLGTLYFGMEAQALPAVSSLVDERRQGKDEYWMQLIEIDDRPHEASGRVVRLPEQAEACVFLWLHGLAQEAVLLENQED